MRYNNKQNDKLNISNGDTTQTTEIGVATSAASSDDTTGRIQWHTGFVHAMRLYLKDYEDDIEFNEEFQLTRKPLSIDLTVVKKPDDLVIDNNIGRFFRKHNILEYKSPKDELNLETFYKVQAYALLYMISPANCDAYGAPVCENDMTISIVRAAYPRELMKELKELGYTIRENIRNIYHVDGAQFPIQIVITKPSSDAESSGKDKKDIIWLNALTTDISKDTYNDFLSNVNELDSRHSMFAETIFAIVSDVNEEKIETWKEAHSMMNDAMKRIMAKELKESKDEGRSEGLAKGRSEGLAEGRSEGQDLLTEAMLTAQKENISDPAKLEELGYDKNTSICTITALKKLGIIS